MRNVSVFVTLFVAAFVLRLSAQGPDTAPLPAAATETREALLGAWVGTLEYRDYSEPATSTKRVKLPTWLNVEPAGTDLRFRYVYDDGPAKTVKEVSLIGIDTTGELYTVSDSAGKVEDRYTIVGLAQLRSGHGTLILNGRGTENQVAVVVRTTLRIGRNILEITRETAAPGEPFAFRHTYTFVRATEPVDHPQGK
jgi:hypothetical protein